MTSRSHFLYVTITSDATCRCQERRGFGGKAGGFKSSLLVNSVILLGGTGGGTGGGMGGGSRGAPRGGKGGGSQFSSTALGDLGGRIPSTRSGTIGRVNDICRRPGEVAVSEDLSPLTEDDRGLAGFLGGISGGGSFSGKFSMLT